MFKDTSVTTSDDPRFSWFIFTMSRNGALSIRFAFTVLVAGTSMRRSSASANWTCKTIVHDNMIIGGLHHRKFAKFATTNAPRPSPMFSYSCRIESLSAYWQNLIQYLNGVPIAHNLNQNIMGLPCMYCFAPCFPK